MHPRPLPRAGLAALAVAALPAPALATWSILIADTRTGEIALGSATCLTGFDLREGTPVIVTGVGAATAQSFVDSTGLNRVFIRDRLLEGLSPDDILDALADFDGGHQTRQYGIVDVLGRTATFSGTGASQWKGGVTGRIERGAPGPADDLVYAVQGNILVGPEPVLAAEQALRTTPGDLADKLMAAMEAARVWGGDGRCSCEQDNPTGCGAPPPEPFKSAHIGYMLIARPGDTDACRSIFPIGDRPVAVVGADLDGVGGTDVIAAPFTGTGFFTARSTSSPGGAFLTLAEPEFTDAGADRLRGVAVGDVTGDGVIDVVITAQQPASIRVFPGSVGPNGVTFAPGPVVPLAANPWRVVVADLDGAGALDIAAATDTDVAVVLSDGVGGLGAPILTLLTGSPRGIDAADLGGATGRDLAVSLFSGSGVAVLHGNADGTFTLAQTLPTAAQPQTVRAADLGGDAGADLVTANASAGSATVLLSSGAGWTREDYPLGGGNGVEAIPADMDADGLTDLVGFAATGRLRVLSNDGVGGFFTLSETTLKDGGLQGGGVVDVRGGGAPAVISGGNQSDALVLVDNRGGTLQDGVGCGAGDYYMTHNTGGRGAGAPDPVFLLQDDFDAWANALVGRPDAVRSVVAGPSAIARGHEVSLLVTLRDRSGAPATAPASLEVLGGGLVGVISVDDLGGGVHRVAIKGEFLGSAAVRIVADDGIRPVRLLPDFPVRILDARADLTGDGLVNLDDIQAFAAGYLAQDPAADLDGNGVWDMDDIGLFVLYFTGGT